MKLIGEPELIEQAPFGALASVPEGQRAQSVDAMLRVLRIPPHGRSRARSGRTPESNPCVCESSPRAS